MTTAWNSAETAPKNGHLLLLLISELKDLDDCANATEDSKIWRTLGFWNDPEERWQFVGWDWCADTFVEGHGEVIGWLPVPDMPTPVTPL